LPDEKSNLVLTDFRYAWRQLRKSPGFTFVAVLTLALGIGANTAIFSVINAVLLQPLPYKNPGQLVMLWENATHLGFPKDTPSPANFRDWRAQNTVFTGMAAMAEKNFNLAGVGEPGVGGGVVVLRDGANGVHGATVVSQLCCGATHQIDAEAVSVEDVGN